MIGTRVWHHVECPGQRQRHGEAEDNEDGHEVDRPIVETERGEEDARPFGHHVSDGRIRQEHANHTPPLQLPGETSNPLAHGSVRHPTAPL